MPVYLSRFVGALVRVLAWGLLIGSSACAASYESSCTRANDCAAGQTCASGSCVDISGASDQRCAHDGECSAPGICETAAGAACTAGVCVYMLSAVGTPCDEGDACTTDASCTAAGECVGVAVQCNTPPASLCLDDDTRFRSWRATGACEPSTGKCIYESIDAACPLCRASCLDVCAGFTCEATEGGCRAGACDPFLQPPACVYGEFAPDLTPCTSHPNGLCFGGRCRECLTAESCQAEHPGYGCNTGTGICRESCVADDDRHCAEGYHCQGGNCVADLATGDACTEDSDCGSALHCQQGLCCRVGMVCCSSTNDCQVSTQRGYICDDAAAACYDRCTTFAQCATGYHCEDGACRSDQGLGQSCDDDNDCAGTLACSNGVCCTSGDTCCGQHSDCGFCEKCSPTTSVCVNQQTFEDLKGECHQTPGSCEQGFCDGAGSCAIKPDGAYCGECQRCDGAGVCLPDSTHHEDCAVCEKCSAGLCIAQTNVEDLKGECPPLPCDQYLSGWVGTTCHTFLSSTPSNGFCSGGGGCSSVLASCQDLGVDVYTCGDAACQRSCPIGASLADHARFSDVCFTADQHGCAGCNRCDATGSCAASHPACGFCSKCLGGACIQQASGEDLKQECEPTNCGDYIYGWEGPYCHLYGNSTAANGACGGNGDCTGLSAACQGAGELFRGCVDLACVDNCPAGMLASALSAADVCAIGEHGDCVDGQYCDVEGACSPRPPVSCEALRAMGVAASGVYSITVQDQTFAVYCDMETDGGGWTLVGSTLATTFNDEASVYYADLATTEPTGGHPGIWDGLRSYFVDEHGSQSDIRFTCKVQVTDSEMTVDLSFYDIHWYTEITTGTDSQSCFSEGNGSGDDQPPPARRNNITGDTLPLGDNWSSGYLEGEDSCGDTGDFTVDFDTRGMDAGSGDHTDWGEDDSSRLCDTSNPSDGAWFVWVREVRGP